MLGYFKKKERENEEMFFDNCYLIFLYKCYWVYSMKNELISMVYIVMMCLFIVVLI